MCTYCGAKYIAQQLESILRQTLQPDELVICDDASTDETIEIIDRFAVRAPFNVRVFRNTQNVGLVSNFEQAIAGCSKDIIFLSDQDDVWHPAKIELTVSVLNSVPEAAGAFSNSDVVNADLSPLNYSLWDACGFTANEQSVFAVDAFASLLEGNKVQGSSLAFRAAYRTLLLPIPSAWRYDAWIAVVLAASAKLIPIDRKLMQYRQHGDNAIGAALRVKVPYLIRQTQKFRRWRRYYSDKLIETKLLLRQLDDLSVRLSVHPKQFTVATASIAQRRARLHRKLRRATLWTVMLGGRSTS
jgi:glycosyltransferase involved in cell wall biosynthesis